MNNLNKNTETAALCPPFLQRKTRKAMKDFDIEKVSALSRLEIKESEKQILIEEMNSMVAFADKVKTSAQYISASKTHTETELRSDTVASSLDRETLLSQAPQSKNGYIAVARTVKESEGGI